MLTLAAAGCVLAIAACGSSAKTHRSAYDQFLAFSKCMRAHGVPSFPDPSSGGGGIHLSGGINAFSPSFKAAQATCSKLLPGGGPGSQHATAQQIARTRQISQCMREHGVSGFPDPTTTPPSSPAGYSILEDRGGVILAVPDTINPQSPVFVQAAKACHFS